MPSLRPFRALRYAPEAGDLAELLAPPYDVIGPEEAKRLRDRHPANCVRLILPEGEAPRRYEIAAATLADWRRQGLLGLDASPGLTTYRQEWQGPDGPIVRLALFASLRLSPFGEGQVLPHERTHSGPKRDRLALTLATRTQLSPVFLTARDPEAALLGALRDASRGEPDVCAETEDGVRHALWRVVDPGVAEALSREGGSAPLLIADGHHRYETALEVRRRIGAEQPGASSVLACVASGSDPGLRIQPTHRAFPGPPAGDGSSGWPEALSDRFGLRPVPLADPSALASEAERRGAPVLVSAGSAWLAEPLPEAARAAGLDDADLAIPSVPLDRLVVEGLLGLDADAAAHRALLSYHREAADAIAAAGDGGAAFLLPAVSQDAVWEVTARGRRLPPKSTYYEPKIPSGLLFRPLDAGDA